MNTDDRAQLIRDDLLEAITYTFSADAAHSIARHEWRQLDDLPAERREEHREEAKRADRSADRSEAKRLTYCRSIAAALDGLSPLQVAEVLSKTLELAHYDGWLAYTELTGPYRGQVHEASKSSSYTERHPNTVDLPSR